MRHRRPGRIGKARAAEGLPDRAGLRDRDIGARALPDAGRKLSPGRSERSDTVEPESAEVLPELAQGQYDQHALEKNDRKRPNAAAGLATLAVDIVNLERAFVPRDLADHSGVDIPSGGFESTRAARKLACCALCLACSGLGSP